MFAMPYVSSCTCGANLDTVTRFTEHQNTFRTNAGLSKFADYPSEENHPFRPKRKYNDHCIKNTEGITPSQKEKVIYIYIYIYIKLQNSVYR
jgi:hypothetical protein